MTCKQKFHRKTSTWKTLIIIQQAFAFSLFGTDIKPNAVTIATSVNTHSPYNIFHNIQAVILKLTTQLQWSCPLQCLWSWWLSSPSWRAHLAHIVTIMEVVLPHLIQHQMAIRICRDKEVHPLNLLTQIPEVEEITILLVQDRPVLSPLILINTPLDHKVKWRILVFEIPDYLGKIVKNIIYL